MAAETDLPSLISAAGAFLSGVAAIVAALRRPPTPTPTPTPDSESPIGSARPTPDDPPRRTAGGDADWTATGFGGLALALALALLPNWFGQDLDSWVLTGARLMITLPFGLAVYFGVRTLREGLTRRHWGLLISACAGLVAALAALATMLIAGTYGPAQGF
jgi:hypothetical protein